MKKAKYMGSIAIRFLVMILPGLLWIATDAISNKTGKAIDWLSAKLPDPQKWR